MTNSFDERTFVVTGAARGQGAAQARRLVERGAHVVLTDLLDAEGAALAADLGDTAIFIRHDVTEEGSWNEVMALAGRVGRLGGVVNNAGIYLPAAVTDTTPELMERHFRVNQLGVLLGMKHGAAALKGGGGGSIVNISSTTGLRGTPNLAAYGGTKWAIRGMTKTAAVELAPFGIRVNSVHPGLIDTAMLDGRRALDLAERAKQIPMGRLGTPDDVAELVLFLLSDLSGYITGAEISIDGGLSL